MGIVSKSWEVQRRAEERARRIGKGKFGRVLRMARKPTNDEYVKVLQITAIGCLAIGALGFLIWWIMTFLPGVLNDFFG